MPTEKPSNPPLRLPVREYTTPVVGEGFYTEKVDYSSPDYRTIQRGTKYSDMVGADKTVIDLFPGLYFLRETRNPASYPFGFRLWATDRQAEDTYNAAVEYVAEAVDFPAFSRVYTVRRDSWEANNTLPVKQPLKTLIAIKVIEPGGNYTSANVRIDPQNDATADPIIDEQGRINSIVITNAGHDFDVAPTIRIDGNGGGAKAVAVIQPKSAILVSQKKNELPDESPLRNEYVLITRVYETLPGPPLTIKRIGQENLTPAKYRRLVRTVETDQTVPADYTFPSGLVGNQTQIELQQETIVKARLKIIEEIIAFGADALIGGDTDQWGALTIYESVVVEGTPIDEGYLILKSSVTPFGNGKSIKITVKYPLDLALRHLLRKTIGQDNLIPPKYRRLVRHQEDDTLVDPATYIFPSFLTGDQSEVRYIEETIKRARLTIISEIIGVSSDALIGEETEEFGIDHITEQVVVEGTPADSGFLIKKSTVTPFGNGKSLKITVHYPDNLASIIVASRLFEPEMQVFYDRNRSIVPAGTDGSFDGAGRVTVVEGIDLWHSQATSIRKVPTAVSPATAILSVEYHPYAFPGLVDTYLLSASDGQLGFKRSRAELCKHTIRTWWVNSPTIPVIAVSDIIQDDITIARITNVTQISFTSAVLANMTGLHDNYLATSIGGSVFYPATTPSFAEYTGKAYTQENGSITFNGGSTSVTGVNTHFLAWYIAGGYIADNIHTPLLIAGVNSDTSLFLAANCPFPTETIPVTFIVVTQGAGWIGTERVIAASIAPTDIPQQWKIQTRSVVMR